MDCTGFDTRLLQSPLASSLPNNVLVGVYSADSQLYLNTLSRLAILPEFTELVFIWYEPLFPDLAARWKAFAHPEQMAAAFARILPVAPYLAGLAEEFIMHQSVAPGDYFFTHISKLSDEEIATVEVDSIDNLLSFWRLLSFRREAFLGMVKVENVAPLLKHPEKVVRYMAVRVMGLILKVADAAREEMFQKYGVGNDSEEKVMGLWEGKEIDYGFLV